MTSFRQHPWAAPLAGGLSLAVVLFVRAGAQPAGQDPVPTPPAAAAASAAKTTAAGVYTAEQANRGEETFANVCQGCHSTADYRTAKFREGWNGKPVAELFQLISETMPEDAPGGLRPVEYAQVIAYLFKLNRLPDGKTELPADLAALKEIKIDFGSSASTFEGGQP